jgi:hypothetical protein
VTFGQALACAIGANVRFGVGRNGSVQIVVECRSAERRKRRLGRNAVNEQRRFSNLDAVV